jgi:SAM-dependent methyltransferase
MVWPPPLREVGAAFDARADSYDDGPMHPWVAAAAADLLPVRPSDLILDAAAGTGLAGRRLLEHQPSVRIVTVDVSAGLLAAGRQADRRLLPVQADLTALPLSDAVVDAAICVSALAYVSPAEVALAELVRVVRPSGTVVVQVWAAGGLLIPRLFRDAAATVGVELVDPNAALGRIDLLIAALTAAGLTQISISETAWRQPMPTPEEAWAGTVASAVGGPVRDLSVKQQRSARRHFIQTMTHELDRSRTDTQPLIIATSARP